MSTKDLSIVFLGARRCGKTSIMASMTTLSSYISNAISVKGDEHSSKKMLASIEKMRGIFSIDNLSNGFWMDDEEGDVSINDYHFTITINRTDDNISKQSPIASIKLTCVDLPGEFFRSGKEEDLIIGKEKIKTADVLIIAIDSPQLVENKALGASRNCIDTITEIIKNSFSETTLGNQKLIIYVPVKCEKYFNSHCGYTIDIVNEKIKKRYENLIGFIKSYPSCMQIIIPVLTLGDLEFDHFTRENGIEKAYYIHTGNKNYSPRNCEQPLLYSIYYSVNKNLPKSSVV